MKLLSNIMAKCKKIRNFLIKLLWAEMCPICSKEIKNETDWFCEICKKGIILANTTPGCSICGKATSVAKCMECEVTKPYITTAGSVLLYNRLTQKLAIKMKNYHITQSVYKYATWMIQQNANLLETTDILIPVPITKIRLLIRKFNQAALLAINIAKITNLEVNVLALRRHITTRKKQAKLTKLDRQKSFNGVFYVHSGQINQITNKRILLIDDVLTTGSTANACAEALILNGAKEVKVLTLLRTPLSRTSKKR